MAFTTKDYSPDHLADILAGTRHVLATTWELSWLTKDEAELVAFLIHVIRTGPGLVTEFFTFQLAGFWGD